MGTLDRYLLKRLLGTFMLVFFGVVGIAATLDILANADEAVKETGAVGGIGVYIIARLPLIALKMAPIAGLLAALITLLSLTRTGELGAAAALGASQGRTARALLPAALGLGLALFAISEFAAPPASTKLRAMGLDPFAKVARPANAVWLRENDDVIRIARISADENVLGGVTIFRRLPDGRLAFEIRAASAERDGGGWLLKDVEVINTDGAPPEFGSEMRWPTPLGPSSYRHLGAHPQELAIADIKAFSANPGSSPKPQFYYDLWLQQKYAGPISAALLLLLAIPFAGRLARNRSLGGSLAVGLSVGFAYFVFDNLALAAAEAGAISAAAGAWGPPAALASLILTLIAFQEKPG